MNQYVTGAVIKELREKKKLTQAELACKLNVSDKTISKWETGKGYPDISLLEALAQALDISVAELLSGSAIQNMNVSSNMLHSNFYVCPVCGNVIHTMGEAAISCHGITLSPLEAEVVEGKMAEAAPDTTDSHKAHMLKIEKVEDEYFVSLDHEMTKSHYISFLAAASSDRMQIVKLYPEGNAQARFKINGVREFFFYCNKDGLYRQKARQPKAK